MIAPPRDGAAVFVHIPNGIFVADNGWELVGAIAGLLLALAAAGSGRYGIDHAVRARHARDTTEPTPAPHPPVPDPRPAVVPVAPPAGRPDYVSRAAAFTEVFPQVSDEPGPPLPRRSPRPSPHPEP